MRIATAFVIGLIFGLGIIVSGMVNPAKVLNFFDVAGHWDPSLAIVMAGALLVTMIGYRLVLKRSGPLLGNRFHLPTNRKMDPKLLSGAAIFGVGWGIAGFCPGAAIPALGTGQIEVLIFVLALIVGILATRGVTRLFTRVQAPASPTQTA
ncbi:MAG: YeeE/YedE family protein [Pseudomonadota bacterium]